MLLAPSEVHASYWLYVENVCAVDHACMHVQYRKSLLLILITEGIDNRYFILAPDVK